MKNKIAFFILICLFPILSKSQEVKRGRISFPGDVATTNFKHVLIGEEIHGHCTVLLISDFILSQIETGKYRRKKSVDKLKVLYSGRIHSQGIAEPFIFQNKSPKELQQLDIVVLPKFQGLPYSLYLDLEVTAKSKSIKEKGSDDAGRYSVDVTVKLKKLKYKR